MHLKSKILPLNPKMWEYAKICIGNVQLRRFELYFYLNYTLAYDKINNATHQSPFRLW